MARARQAWAGDPAGVAGIAPERLVFLDECGVLTNMARLYGRSPRGERARGPAPCGRWERLTVLGALGHGGVIAAMGVEAATSAASASPVMRGAGPPATGLAARRPSSRAAAA